MKFFKNSISILLVLAVVNTFAAKAIHEFFEHHDVEHTCINKELTHFHENEIQHLDLICHFNFSVSLLDDFAASLDEGIYFQESKVKIHFLWLAKNLCYRSISLRGPPNNL